MSRSQPSTDLLAALVESFTNASSGGYCGQTHIHKAAFIAQELLGVPFGLEWELYTHGPFSRDVRPGLDHCQQTGTVATLVHPKGLRITRPADAPHAVLPAEFREKIQLVAQRLALMDRDQLEKVATAAWVTRFADGHGMDVQSRAVQVNELKPHIEIGIAAKAVTYLDDLVSRSGVRSSSSMRPDPTLMRRLAGKTAELYPSNGSLDVYRPRLRARIVVDDMPRDSSSGST